MAVKHIDLERFTVFETLSLDFSPGINVFLGANATGKSHLMKVIYAVLRTRKAMAQVPGWEPNRKLDTVSLGELAIKLVDVFRPDGRVFGRLERINPDGLSTRILVTFGDGELDAEFDGPNGSGATWKCELGRNIVESNFLPAREVLSMYEGFTAAYENRELSFDGTYNDICKALSATPLKGPKAREADRLLQPLKERVQAEVKRRGDRFYVEMLGEAPFEAHLVAEGYRKLASLMYLIKNGSIGKNSVLFWDEPEANLNPRLIKVVADFLLSLAASGIQIFVATHDYLLTNELSLQAEYHTEAAKKAEIRFFGFHREGNGPAQVQTGAMLADLDQNPIMEEFAALYERERKLFREAGSAEKPGA